MTSERRYSIRKNRLIKASYNNMKLEDDIYIKRINDSKASYIVTQYIDSGEEDSQWGRLHFNANANQEVVYHVYVLSLNKTEFLRKNELVDVQQFLSDKDIDISTKQAFFNSAQAISVINQSDILLYSLSGRYLWIMITIDGMGECVIDHITIDMIGDNFIYSFPEVYRERNSFFHRYMSIYSSLYNDFQNQIDNCAQLIDVNSAPLDLLIIYAGWFGIDIQGGFLTEDKVRSLMCEIFTLVKKKGSRYALEKAAEIVIGEKPIILEKRFIEKTDTSNDIVILTKVDFNEKQRAQLQLFLEQFVPIRSRLQLIYLNGYNEMDQYTYLDINASLKAEQNGQMDEGVELDQMYILS